MKRLLYLFIGIGILSGMWSCGSSEENAENAQQDSIRIADSLRQVEELRVADSISVAESAAQDEAAAQADAEAAKIDKKLNEYEKCMSDLRRLLSEDDIPPSSSSAACRYSERIDAALAPLKNMRSKMTPEQKSRFERIDNQIDQLLEEWADRDEY